MTLAGPMEMPGRLRRRAVFALFGAAAFWGLSFPLGKAIGHSHAALDASAAGWFITASTIWPRFALASLIVLPWAWRLGRRARWTRREIKQGVGLALFLSGGLALQIDGLQHTPASTSAFLSQFFVIILPLVVFGRQRRWPPPRFVAAALLVLTGVGLLANVNWSALHIGRGEVETLISNFFFCGQILLLERAEYRDNRAAPVTAVMFALTAAIFVVLALALAPDAGAPWRPWGSASWIGFTLGLTLFCTVGSFVLMNTWQRWLSSAEAGLIYSTEPVWASLFALILPGWLSVLGGLAYANESLTSRLLLGGGLITAANVLIQLAPARRATAAEMRA